VQKGSLFLSNFAWIGCCYFSVCSALCNLSRICVSLSVKGILVDSKASFCVFEGRFGLQVHMFGITDLSGGVARVMLSL